MSEDNDQLYIAKIVAGDAAAFTVLVNRYKNMVFTLALQILKNREEAEEVAQDTFIKAYGALSNFKGNAKFSTWLYRIAYNSCLDRVKTYKRTRVLVEIDEFTEKEVVTLETAMDYMERSDRQKAVLACLKLLPEEDSFLITLFYYEELSLEEISKVLALRPNHLKVKLFRARKRLATIFKKRLEPEILKSYGQGN